MGNPACFILRGEKFQAGWVHLIIPAKFGGNLFPRLSERSKLRTIVRFDDCRQVSKCFAIVCSSGIELWKPKCDRFWPVFHSNIDSTSAKIARSEYCEVVHGLIIPFGFGGKNYPGPSAL